ncbi:MAG: hypothetical protein IT306_04005 [Chloroflexi bacterium]|nr:hypothetical protein [Chloroflexota bacterium]
MSEEQRGRMLRSERDVPPDGELVRVRRDGKIAASPVGSREELAEHTARLAKAAQKTEPPRRFEVRRRTDNELILFVADRRESWIVYPPRSQYEFLERPSVRTVLVEHHPWEPYTESVMHEVEATQGCSEHGLACGASAAIQAGIRLGWNPFA